MIPNQKNTKDVDYSLRADFLNLSKEINKIYNLTNLSDLNN